MAKGKGGFIGQDGLNAPDAPTGVSGTAGDTQVTVSWTAPSDVGGSAITGYNVVGSDGARASGFSASAYTNNSFSTNSQDTAPVDIKFRSNGLRMFILGIQNRSVYEYELSAAYDITTATYTDAFSVATQATGGYGLFFKSDGTSFYIADIDSETIYQYNCSTAWDISTASYASKSFSVSSQSTDPRGLWFKPDGTKMYVGPSGTTDAIFQYSLSTAWDVSTASYDSVSLDVTDQESFVRAIGLNSDGTKLYVIGNSDTVYEYALPTAYVLTDGAYTGGNVDVSSQETTANGFAFNNSENNFYINGTGSDTVFEYSVGEYPTASPVTITGLTNGTSYTFNVWAINAFGWSAPSDASGSVIPALLQRALFAGGSTNIIDYVDITTAGNATDFGDLIASDRFLGGFGSATRGIFSGGDNTNRIQYVTIATTGNATDFGDMSYTPDNNSEGGCSNSTRGMNGAGYNGGFQNNIDYVTIATTGNGTDFGDLVSGRYGVSALASPTRAIWCGGESSGGFQNVLEYVTIASTSNTSDFGDLTNVRRTSASTSSSTRGLIGGSYTAPGSTPYYQNIDYITIASTGNAADFGDASTGFAGGAATSGSTKALFQLGTTSSGLVNTIDQFTIATLGNSTDFGDITSARDQGTATSSYHGGLQ